MAVKAVPGLAMHIGSDLTVVGWKPTFQRGMDEAFVKLADYGLHVPTSEANFDLDRFLAKYFLDGLNGKPVPRKTPDPITLYPFFEHQDGLRTAVASIPGLHLCEAHAVYSLRTLIGWDINKVKLQKRKIEEEAAKTKASEASEALAVKEDKRHHDLQPHREYMKNHHAAAGPLSLDNLAGSYIVQSETAEEYRRDDEAMTLDIIPPDNAHGTVATFNLGLVEGTMLLALSDDALHLLRQDVGYDPEDSDGDDYDGYGNKRKRKAEGTHAGQGPIKRRLGASPKPNRVYFQWAGRDTGERVIQLDYDNKHYGYLDFDVSKAHAKGQFAHPSFFGDEPLIFSIHKTTDRPSKKTPDSWSQFSEKQYAYECGARWH